MKFVPVVDIKGELLMPTTICRANRWIKQKKATRFYIHGIMCIRLNFEPSARNMQEIIVGIDPGTKKEGFTVKSAAHTYLNILTDAVTWVKEALEKRMQMRRNRRRRKTPYRKSRFNRSMSKNWVSPSIKARWGWKLRICLFLNKIVRITSFVVEDIKVPSKKGKKRWNKSFSVIEHGKNWFYAELKKLAPIILKAGRETAKMRKDAGLKKNTNKLAKTFSAHCVDSWVLANFRSGGHIKPDNEDMVLFSPIMFHRRQLHKLKPAKGGKRAPYGGTRSMGLKRGSLVVHPKYGYCYVGGTAKTSWKSYRITLLDIKTGERVSRDIRPEDCKFKSYNTWKTSFIGSSNE